MRVLIEEGTLGQAAACFYDENQRQRPLMGFIQMNSRYIDVNKLKEVKGHEITSQSSIDLRHFYS